MPVESWRTTTVGELCDRGVLLTQTGPFGSQLHSCDYVPQGVPVIPTEGIGRRRLLTAGIPQVSSETAARLSRHRLRKGDILFARRGVQATGLSAIVTSAEEGWLCGTGAILLRVNAATIDPVFLSFLLSADETVAWLKQHAVGAVMPNLNEGVILQIPLTLPPLEEQLSIGKTLQTLDDKIELNRRMNATLEAMARALFQSWFVDFDPVRAKLDGRAPVGMDADTAALFPDSFEETAGRPIPKGWTRGSILRQATLLSGGTPKTDVEAYWNGDIPWASAKDVSQCGDAFLIATERTITLRGVDESSTRMIAPLATVVVARGATTGRLAMLGHSMAMNQTCYGLHSTVAAPYALYCNTRHIIERLVAGGHGSIFDTITTSTFQATDVLLAPDVLLKAFDEQVAPLFEHIRANLYQSQTLARLRDTLLPRLLSGELRIGGVA